MTTEPKIHHFRQHPARPGDCWHCSLAEADHPPMTEPYDPSPNPLKKATHGFIRCPRCERVAQLPHACAEDIDPGGSPAPKSSHSSALARAELAESILTAMALDHGLWRIERASMGPGSWMTQCDSGCVFCEAAK